MATYTSKLNLKKPAGSENVAIGDINNNMDLIDTFASSVESNLTHRRSAGTYTSQNQYGVYGFVTTSSTIASLFIPMVFNISVSSVQVTSLVISLRVASGGYLVGNESDVTQYINSIQLRLAQGIIQIDLKKNDGFGVTNNTPFVGSATMTYVVS